MLCMKFSRFTLRKYFDTKNHQIDHIKQMLMAVNAHIAASSLTNTGFALAASSVAVGMNLSLELSALIGSWASRGIASLLSQSVLFNQTTVSGAPYDLP